MILDPRLALTIIAARGCSSSTAGLGSCVRDGRHLISFTGSADEVCAACVAHAALEEVAPAAPDPSRLYRPAAGAEPPPKAEQEFPCPVDSCPVTKATKQAIGVHVHHHHKAKDAKKAAAEDAPKRRPGRPPKTEPPATATDAAEKPRLQHDGHECEGCAEEFPTAADLAEHKGSCADYAELRAKRRREAAGVEARA